MVNLMNTRVKAFQPQGVSKIVLNLNKIYQIFKVNPLL
ncbi:hypothetical protein COO91_02866 [Nostoc flagelliforme CCNUN1]|uniref:Uncharacterized protein n=1 Tax=Nostoc flagelliforme CCNUN1 TaxID=2038116 RepID=A0A2K8SNE9_9NOSO|nr:hypothetical protein COO91_02866 [Nostoc flagelliforme CCNUN1]